MCDRIVKIKVVGKKISVDRKVVHVCRYEKDQVVWVGNLPFAIQFRGAGPFRRSRFAGARRTAKSGPAVRGRRAAFFKYTISVRGARPLDPGVKTDP